MPETFWKVTITTKLVGLQVRVTGPIAATDKASAAAQLAVILQAQVVEQLVILDVNVEVMTGTFNRNRLDVVPDYRVFEERAMPVFQRL